MKNFVFIALFCSCFVVNIFGQTKIKVLKYQAPRYPAAAQATLTSGEIRVLIKIDKEGKVSSTKAEGGHPFFRTIAEEAATKWLFSKDINLNKRKLEIIFVFNIKSDNSSKNNYRATKIKTRFVKPYRLEILAISYSHIDV